MLLLAVGFNAAAMGVASFPLDMEGTNFATGALKVNPADGENEAGLEAVALTIGDENVNGIEGGVEAFSGSFLASVSFAGVMGVTLDEAVPRGGRGEVKSNVGKGKVLLGSEIRGRSGTSATSSSSSRLDETRVVVFSLLILPPPEVTLLAAGVLERG